MATNTTSPAQAVDILEGSFLKVPFEALRRAAKDRKSLLDEAQEAATSLATKGKSATEQVESLSNLLSRLQGIKRKLTDVSKAEKEEASRCKSRLEHLQARLGMCVYSCVRDYACVCTKGIWLVQWLGLIEETDNKRSGQHLPRLNKPLPWKLALLKWGHLNRLQVLSEPRENMIAWNNQRMDRILVDHLQRCAWA